MTTLIDITISTLFGGASGGLIAYLTKTYFAERIKAKIKNEYDVKVENLRSELTKSNTILNTVLTAQNQGYQLGQNERINAIKIFWDKYLTIKKDFAIIRTYDEIILESEFEKLFTKDWKGNKIIEETYINIPDSKLNIISDIIDNVEKLRPFLNEESWLYFVFYTTFCGRILFIYKNNSRLKLFSHWKKDSSLVDLCKEYLTNEEFNYIQNSQISTIKSVENFVEQKLLFEISKMVTGQLAADNTYNHAIRLLELTKPNKTK